MGTSDQLIDILADYEAVSPTALERVVHLHAARGGSLADLLVREAIVDEEDLYFLMSRHLGVPAIPESRLLNLTLSSELRRRVPRALARQCVLVPLDLDVPGGRLSVALFDPTDEAVLERLRQRSRVAEIRVYLARRAAILTAVESLYAGEETDEEIDPAELPLLTPRPAAEEDPDAPKVQIDPGLEQEIAAMGQPAFTLRPPGAGRHPRHTSRRRQAAVGAIAGDDYSGPDYPTTIHRADQPSPFDAVEDAFPETGYEDEAEQTGRFRDLGSRDDVPLEEAYPEDTPPLEAAYPDAGAVPVELMGRSLLRPDAELVEATPPDTAPFPLVEPAADGDGLVDLSEEAIAEPPSGELEVAGPMDHEVTRVHTSAEMMQVEPTRVERVEIAENAPTPMPASARDMPPEGLLRELLSGVGVLVSMLEERIDPTAGSGREYGRLCRLVARELGMDELGISRVALAAHLFGLDLALRREVGTPIHMDVVAVFGSQPTAPGGLGPSLRSLGARALGLDESAGAPEPEGVRLIRIVSDYLELRAESDEEESDQETVVQLLRTGGRDPLLVDALVRALEPAGSPRVSLEGAGAQEPSQQ